ECRLAKRTAAPKRLASGVLETLAGTEIRIRDGRSGPETGRQRSGGNRFAFHGHAARRQRAHRRNNESRTLEAERGTAVSRPVAKGTRSLDPHTLESGREERLDRSDLIHR